MALQDLKTVPQWYDFRERYQLDIVAFAIEALDMTVDAGQAISWQQEILFESICLPSSRTTVASGHGCFAAGTKLRLANGQSKPIELIDLDDELLGADGVKVVGVHDLFRGKESMYRFTYSDGSSHTFNKSHILCLIANNSQGNRIRGQKITVTVEEWLKWNKNKQAAYSIYRLKSAKTKGKSARYSQFAINSAECLGVGNYYGIMVDGDRRFLLADGTVVHNTGKSRSAGVVALWHLLCFPDSITMFTAPQIGQLRKIVWKEIAICYDRLKNGVWGWLADYVVILAELVYIKGYDKTWHVLAKTAPKHQPTNIAGQHGDNYLLWVDEASGVDDAVMEVVMGALTHPDNKAVLTSQPTRNAGFFYDTHHKLSHRSGGVWRALTFNGEQSPLVSEKVLRELFEKYGSRDDAGYMIRVRGLFPDLTGEFLLSNTQADDMYVGNSLFAEHDDFGYIISVDVGGGVGRDDSVIVIAKVWGEAHWAERARRVEVVEIPLCKNTDNIHELAGIIDNAMANYPNASLVIDANGAGRGLAQHLTSKGIFYTEVHWGGQCFSNDARKHYANKRSQAIVCMTRAAAGGRLKIMDKRHKVKITEQITRLPYSFDDHTRYWVMPKEQMKAKRGLKSPDIADALAFLFLDGIYYVSANEGGHKNIAAEVEDSFKGMESMAETAFD